MWWSGYYYRVFWAQSWTLLEIPCNNSRIIVWLVACVFLLPQWGPFRTLYIYISWSWCHYNIWEVLYFVCDAVSIVCCQAFALWTSWQKWSFIMRVFFCGLFKVYWAVIGRSIRSLYRSFVSNNQSEGFANIVRSLECELCVL